MWWFDKHVQYHMVTTIKLIYIYTTSRMEKEMATQSSILDWRIPWTEESGGLYSPWGHRVGHDLVTDHVTSHSYPFVGENN